jgi:hypothetical protein
VIALRASPGNVSRSLGADVLGGGEEATSKATMPPRMLPIEIGLALVVVVSAPPEAPATVAWEEGSACADEIAFDDALTRRLGTKPEGREWVEVDARVAAIASESGVRAHVQLRTAHGETTREMAAGSCTELTDALALLVAMHVDPLLDPTAPEAEIVEEEVEAEVPEPTPPEPPPPAKVEPAPDPLPIFAAPRTRSKSRPPPRGIARLDVGAAAGPLPRFGPAVGLAVGVLWLPLRAEVRARYLAPQRFEGDAGRGALLQAWTLGPRICGEPGVAKLTFPLCLGLDAGAMHGAGRGVAQRASGMRAMIVLPASVGLAVEVHRVIALTAEAEAGATVLRPSFVIENLGTLYKTPAWMVRAALGVEVRFP